MRILILGGGGMIGHQMFDSLSQRFDVHRSFKRSVQPYQGLLDSNDARNHFNVDVLDTEHVSQLIDVVKPTVVINAVGVVKQRDAAKEAITAIELNALLPHRLAALCQPRGIRVIHFSTDCIFSGELGSYSENDAPDAQDLYGKTKVLGELNTPGTLTLRTSTIGLELFPANYHGLLEWFLAQQGDIQGYRKAIYSGVTTIELARVVERVLLEHTELHGIWQVASKPIDKYSLLQRLAVLLQRQDITIHENMDLVCDRSLSSQAFFEETGYLAPEWDTQLDELATMINRRGTPQ